MFGWECCPGWYQFAHYLELFIMDAFVDLFITLCIVINTVFMAMDHAGMSDQMTNTLAIGNYVCTFLQISYFLAPAEILLVLRDAGIDYT